MDEELEKESSNIQTETQTSVERETTATLDSLPRIEDLRKSEQEVKINTQLEGVSQIEQRTQSKDRVFTKRSDEKKVYIKKRLKIVTAVYTTVVVMLLAFVISNIVTLAILNKSSNTNTDTIQSAQQQVQIEQATENPGESLGDIKISLNEPRDYSEDKKELTWLDKIIILFRNLFS